MSIEESKSVEETPEGFSPTDQDNQTPPDLLWISEGSDIIISTIYIYKDPVSGRLRSILTEPLQFMKDDGLGLIEYPIETRWSVPSKSQMDSYRERSARYNPAARAVLVQRAILEDLVIRNHLLEMTLGSGDHQTTVELKRDDKGKLTSKTMDKINSLHPSVMDMIFAKFIDEAALIL